MRVNEQKISSVLMPYLVWVILCLFYFAVGLQTSVQRGLLFACIFTAEQFFIYQSNKIKLIPTFFEKDKKRFYIWNLILLIILVAVASSLDRYISQFFRDQHDSGTPNVLFPVFIHLVIAFVAFWVSIAQYLLEKEKMTKIEIEELKREKAESELKFLKMQINPHFLFNALNNIYTMAYTGDKSTADKIAMLSDMLRYVLYDCSSEFISLEKELEYLNNYIEFQQLKTEKKQNISFSQTDYDKSFLIAPMLLIPFIENAFKHSIIEKNRSGYVYINLEQHKNKLLFTVKNSIVRSTQTETKKEKGIGIENVKNRLELLYPKKHKLIVKNDDLEHFVSLELMR